MQLTLSHPSSLHAIRHWALSDDVLGGHDFSQRPENIAGEEQGGHDVQADSAVVPLICTAVVVGCTAALQVKNPTITEMGVSSHIYDIHSCGATIVCASAEHAENDTYLPLISAFLHFQGGV